MANGLVRRAHRRALGAVGEVRSTGEVARQFRVVQAELVLLIALLGNAKERVGVELHIADGKLERRQVRVHARDSHYRVRVSDREGHKGQQEKQRRRAHVLLRAKERERERRERGGFSEK